MLGVREIFKQWVNMNKNISAGEFSVWLEGFTQTMRGVGEGSVPCGECVGCCTSSKFIHIRPTDKKALGIIPQELMFQAPRLPSGHSLLGYDEKGHCPLFKDGKCSIYESRPETCRQYDCRVLAASNFKISDESMEINERVNSWHFKYSNAKSIELSHAVKLAGAFLSKNKKKFPDGFIPLLNGQLAVMAVRVHPLFIGHTLDTVSENVVHLVNEIVEVCNAVK